MATPQINIKLDHRHFVDEASVIVFQEDGVVYALDTRTKALIGQSQDGSMVIQKAIEFVKNGGEITIKEGKYILSSKITIPYDKIRIRGCGLSTILVDNVVSDHLIAVRKPDGSVISGVEISDLRIECNVAKTTGDEINLHNLFVGRVENVFIEGNAKALNGLYITYGNNIFIDNVRIYNVKGNAVVFNGNNDVYFHKIIIDNPANPKAQDGFCILRSEGSLYIVDSDIINCRYGIIFSCWGNIIWTWIINTAVDNCTKCIVFPAPYTPGCYVAGCYFIGGWASSADAYNIAIENGAILSDVKFIDMRSYNANCSGIYIGPANITGLVEFINCTFASNSRELTNFHHGVFFESGAGKVKFVNCVARNDPKLGTGTQGYGIFFNGPVSDVYIIECDLRGNGIGAIGNPQHLSGRVVHTLGYDTENSGVATISAGSTRVTVSHGLISAPSKVLITPLGQPAGKLWVENITSTSFDIVTDTAPTSNLNIAWRAEV